MFGMFSRLEESTDVQELTCYLGSAVRSAARKDERARRSSMPRRRSRPAARSATRSRSGRTSRRSSRELEAALELGDLESVGEQLLDALESSRPDARPPYLDAHGTARFEHAWTVDAGRLRSRGGGTSASLASRSGLPSRCSSTPSGSTAEPSEESARRGMRDLRRPARQRRGSSAPQRPRPCASSSRAARRAGSRRCP